MKIIKLDISAMGGEINPPPPVSLYNRFEDFLIMILILSILWLEKFRWFQNKMKSFFLQKRHNKFFLSGHHLELTVAKLGNSLKWVEHFFLQIQI